MTHELPRRHDGKPVVFPVRAMALMVFGVPYAVIRDDECFPMVSIADPDDADGHRMERCRWIAAAMNEKHEREKGGQ